MKILIVNFEYPPLGGGGGVATRDIARELAKHHEVHVVTTRYQGLAAEEDDRGVHIYRARVIGRRSLPIASVISMLTFVPSAAWRGWRLCRRYNFDVINAQFVLPSGLPAAILARLFEIPFVLSFIGGDVYDPTKGISPHRYAFLRWLIRLIARRAVICTAISSDTKRQAELVHGVTQKIVVTHLGLNPSAVTPANRQELGLPADKLLFISIGRLIPRKGYEVLLEAWKSIPNAQLLISGSGPLEDKLRVLINHFQIADRVTLLGFVSEERKQQLLRVADAYISTAWHEGFGIVFLEAMEAGLPIIATSNGGHTDFLIDQENALLIPTDDPLTVVTAVQRLLSDSTLRQKLAANNREKVRQFYLEKTVKKFEDVLMQAYARRH